MSVHEILTSLASSSGGVPAPKLPSSSKADDSTLLLVTTTTSSGGDPQQHTASIIQVDRSQSSGASSNNSHKGESSPVGYTCDGGSMCGPHPTKITVSIFILLSVWTSIILGAHVHKKVASMEEQLARTSQDLADLQIKFLELRQSYDKEVDVLHRAIQELAAVEREEEEEMGKSMASQTSKGTGRRAQQGNRSPSRNRTKQRTGNFIL